MSQSINFSSVKRANFNSTRLKEILLNGNLIWKEAKECKETGTFETGWVTPWGTACLSHTTNLTVDMCPSHRYNFKWYSNNNAWAWWGTTQIWKVTEIYEDGHTQSYEGSISFGFGPSDSYFTVYERANINRTSHSSHGNLKTLKYQTGTPCGYWPYCLRAVQGVFRL